MDPVTVIGLVTNVVQLVDVSWKIVSKSREIHRVGALPEQRDTQTVTADLQRVNQKVLAFLSISEAGTDLSEDEKSLQLLCESSNRIATELLARLTIVRPGDEHQRWKSLRQALKSVWIKSELDETAARLQSYRSQLNTRILVSLQDQIGAVVQSNKNIASSIQENRVTAINSQEIQTDYLTRFIASQHNETRELLASLTTTSAPPAYSVASSKEIPSSILRGSDSRDAAFKAVDHGDMTQIRRILREDPQAVLSYNQFGQTLLYTAARKGDSGMVAYLIRNGASINPDDDSGRLPIHAAAEAGSEAVVRILMNKGADPVAKDMDGKTARDLCPSQPLLQWIMLYGAALEAKNEHGNTALYHFASQGNLDAVRTLIAQEAAIETRADGSEKTPLWVASDNGHAEVVAYLLAQGAAVNARDSRRSTPLIAAGWHGHKRVGELLLDHGADIEATNQHKFTALHESLDHGRIEMAHMLLARGARADSFNEFGYAPLHRAAMHGYAELVRVIFDRGGIDVNLLNPKAHWTALAEACEHGHLAVVEILLAHGADTKVSTGSDRQTALMRAAKYGFSEIVHRLLERNANVDAVDSNDRTALYLAVAKGHTATIRLLLGKSSQKTINQPDKEGYTSLCRAAQSGYVDSVRMLVDAGALVDCPGKDGWTPLHEAAWHHHTQTVQVLLDHNASLSIRNRSGRTALEWAQLRRHKDIIEILQSHQARISKKQ